MNEPDVVLTDYLLALESCVFAVLTWRLAGGSLRVWLGLYFAGAAVASACGGTVHGFFSDEQALGAMVLWRVALVAIGVSTLANWAIGGESLFSPRAARWVTLAAALQLIVYCFVVIFVTQDFRVAIVDNLPALVFLIVALVVAYRRQGRGGLLVAAGGLALTLVAAALQQLQVGVDPRYFNYNAVFHTLQAIALLLFFLGCRWSLFTGAEASRHVAVSQAAR
jgi:hypothetical protein